MMDVGSSFLKTAVCGRINSEFLKCKHLMFFQLVDKLNTNTETEEMINEYSIVSTPCKQKLCCQSYFICLDKNLVNVFFVFFSFFTFLMGLS